MPLIKSGSKKALKKNIETEMKSNPDPKDRKQNLAIAFSIQRKNKRKKYAQGGQVARDQEPIKKENYKKLGDEYEGDNEPKSVKGASDSYSSPAMREYMSSKMPTEGSKTPKDSDEHAPDKKEYSGGRYAKGGAVYDREPGVPKAKPDDHRLDEDDYMSDEWAGGPDIGGADTSMGPSHAEYMADHFAKGGHVACMHCGGMGYADGGHVELDDEKDPFDHGEGISDYQEEGPGTRVKYNINSRDYNQGDDRQISSQPKDSNEHGDELSDEDEHSMIEQIRKKLKAKKEY